MLARLARTSCDFGMEKRRLLLIKRLGNQKESEDCEGGKKQPEGFSAY